MLDNLLVPNFFVKGRHPCWGYLRLGNKNSEALNDRELHHFWIWASQKLRKHWHQVLWINRLNPDLLGVVGFRQKSCSIQQICHEVCTARYQIAFDDVTDNRYQESWKRRGFSDVLRLIFAFTVFQNIHKHLDCLLHCLPFRTIPQLWCSGLQHLYDIV